MLYRNKNNGVLKMNNVSRLVNEFVKAKNSADKIEAQIKEQTKDLQQDLKDQNELIKNMRSNILDLMKISNSKKLASATNFIVLKPVHIKAHDRNHILVNKEK